METIQVLVSQFKEYFISINENSIYELSIFVLITFILYLGNHFFTNLKTQLNRKKIPLVIGGWGTRGKSSTERLKAALINALGLSVLGKATGCEATLIYSPPFGTLKEIPLFRPYDKASIWEQNEVMSLATKFNAQVFLWECMGLDPDYVKILQKQWMHDNLTTMTNTFPDHEDIQGPSGYDIAKTMSSFMPTNSKIFVAEEQMLPILQNAALRENTNIQTVTWKEIGLLSDDVMSLFSYKEHPENVALVLALAKQLDLSETYALKEMIERVVPDLGVLKTFPVAMIRTRQMEFSNGMSGNDRVSALSNWDRLKFSKNSLKNTTNAWVSILVNNRKDRVSRSQMFASMLVNDMLADNYFLIGSNLTGFMGYVEEAWGKFSKDILLWSETSSPQEMFKKYCEKFKIPHSLDLVRIRLSIMLQAQNTVASVEELLADCENPDILSNKLVELKVTNSEAIIKQLKKDIEIYNEFLLIKNNLSENTKNTKTETKCRTFLKKCFLAKFVPIEDESVSGEKIINILSHELPPGFYHRILGIQNIKGPGLDFVHRWQTWENCYKTIILLKNRDIRRVKKGLQTLATYNDFSLLCEETMLAVLNTLKENPIMQQEDTRALVMLIQEKIKSRLKLIRKEIALVKKNSFFEMIILFFESFLDPGYAIKRRKTADQVYEDLSNKRISTARAIKILQELTLEQTGGYLYHRVLSLRAKFGVSNKLEMASDEKA